MKVRFMYYLIYWVYTSDTIDFNPHNVNFNVNGVNFTKFVRTQQRQRCGFNDAMLCAYIIKGLNDSNITAINSIREMMSTSEIAIKVH